MFRSSRRAAPVALLSVLALASVVSAQPLPDPLSASAYVALAAASDRFEVSEAHLAIARGSHPRIKSFARMMERDHAKSGAMVRAAVRAGDDRNPQTAMLSPKQARMLAALRLTPMRRFDEVYIAQQVQAHNDALALHRAYAARGSEPELRQTAQLIAPVVQQHLDLARDLQQRMLARGR